MKTKGIYFLYRLLQALAGPALLVYFLIRGLKNRAYFGTLGERFGFLPRTFQQTAPGAIWLHAVSVGEVIACLPLAARLREQHPKAPLFVSAGTLAGQATARQKLGEVAAGIFYAPVDYVFAVRSVLRRIRPSVIVVAETEIWPNLFREARRAGCGLLIVNGRISDKALPRYLRFRTIFHEALPAADAILAQNEANRDRFISIGGPAEVVQAAGNLKYDFQPSPAPADSPVRKVLQELKPRKVWIAASTMPPAEPGDPDEDDAVLAAFRQLPPDVFLILAPRKPERFGVVAEKLEAAGLPFVRRSAPPVRLSAATRVLLLDTIGELAGIFALGDAVFMGGTLAHRGGHNILEPAFFGKPTIVGPHMENFAEIADDFEAAGACIRIRNADELGPAVAAALSDPGEVGSRALACAQGKRGATERTLEAIRALFETRYPCFRSAYHWILLPLSKLWETGGRRRLAKGLMEMRRLRSRVISVGNLSMGGTGKTPVVLFLAERCQARGRKPGIVTRGYGRSSPASYLVLDAGAFAPVQHSGDEPQIFLRSGIAPVGIGSDRATLGRMLENQYDTDVILLDDGFQHVKLARDVDLVLIDGLNPFAGCRPFPLGRLREPLTSLARATAFLITRSDYGPNIAAVESILREHNPRAPIFHSHVIPECWVERRTGRCLPLDQMLFRRVGGFCGLGNPQSFWRTLDGLGIDVAAHFEYEDHHRYKPKELRSMQAQFVAAGAEACVTTEKDFVNLCDDCDDLFHPLQIYWLKIRARIDEEEEFLNYLFK